MYPGTIMENVSLNLARSWRSKNFDQIIGQELSVRILKNSLYLNQFFPVYLLAGQRGCGKTSTARVFASAINCKQLEAFQKEPKSNSVPCQACESCLAMTKGKHPDFIEMDAASHTGVDNVRQIIEASTFMPLMGRKKIYLIDEAHMLSKAAFNAFLKILEEPPASVLFLLATTDPEKIIETVRSRCFQLFFTPIEHETLIGHLRNVCTKEKISYDDQGLACIAHESDGSVRDALNMLEQIRFAHGQVTNEAVKRVLGHLDDERLLQLFDAVYAGQMGAVVESINSIDLVSFAPQPVWDALYQLVRSALWLSYGVQDKTTFGDMLHSRANQLSAKRVTAMLAVLCEYELLFARSSKKHHILEMVLLRMCMPTQASVQDVPNVLPQQERAMPSPAKTGNVSLAPKDTRDVSAQAQESRPTVGVPDAVVKSEDSIEGFDQWAAFLSALESVNDQLLTSVFKQAQFVSFDSSTSIVCADFDNRFLFFKDLIDEAEVATWLKLLKQAFGADATLARQFKDLGHAVVAPVRAQAASSSSERAVATSSRGAVAQQSRVAKRGLAPIDVSDENEWPVANQLLKHFSGTVNEIVEGGDEESS